MVPISGLPMPPGSFRNESSSGGDGKGMDE